MSVARIYRVAAPYGADDVNDLDFEQSADRMYFAHLRYPPYRLTRADHADWSWDQVTLAPTIAAPTGIAGTATTPNTDAGNSGNAYFPQAASYVVTAVSADGIESRPSAVQSLTNDLGLKRNYNEITWSSVTGAALYRVYKAENTGDYGYIGTTLTTSFRDDNIGPSYDQGPPSAENPFSGEGSYPSTVSFYEQRLVFARSTNNPNAVWASRSGEYENFDTSRPLRNSDALSFALLAGRVNAVNQLVSMKNLLALTSDSVFNIRAADNGPLGPTNVATTRENGRGGSRLGPIVVDNVAFYQPSVGNGVRSIGYRYENDAFNSDDVSIFSPALFRGFDIVSWAYVQEPWSVIWAVRSDGKLLAFTWEQSQEVWGWTLCDTDGVVKSVAAISEGGEDRLYLVVERGGKLLIERMASARWDSVDDSCYLDSAVSYEFDTPQTELRNLDHLEGRTITALADGAVISGLVVTGGVVTLPSAATKVTAGLPYEALVETLPLAVQTGKGWSVAKPQSAARVLVRLKDSRGVEVGPDETKMEHLRERRADAYGAPPSLKTGVFETVVQPHLATPENPGVSVVVRCADPVPFTLTGVLLDPSVSP